MAAPLFRSGGACDRAGAAAAADLRHTAISLWIAAGDNPKVVSVRAGHSSVAFTLDVYGHLYRRHDERSRARLDALIAEAEPTPRATVHELHKRTNSA